MKFTPLFGLLLLTTIPSRANYEAWKTAVEKSAPAFTLFEAVSGTDPRSVDVGTLTGDRAFEFIVNSGTVGASQVLTGSGMAGSGLQGLKFEQWSETGLYGFTDYGITDYSATGVPFDTGRNVHIVYSSDGATTNLYVDGVLRFNFPRPLNLMGMTGLAGCLGSAGTYSDPLDGSILGFAVYDTALSEAQVQELYGKFHASIPPTDILLSRSVFAANTPAGGLVGHLTAVDADHATHTFVIAGESGDSKETLIDREAAAWFFLDGNNEAPEDWAFPTFNAAGWANGQAPLGYSGEGMETWQHTRLSYGVDTNNKAVTSWYRKTFTVTNSAQLTSLAGTIQVDDGCVIYVNGVEAFRQNMPEGPVFSSTFALSAIGGTDENDYTAFTVPQALLPNIVEGENVIAVEVHQSNLTSSDITFDLTLEATFTNPGSSYDNALFAIDGSSLRLTQPASAIPAGPKFVRVIATDADRNSFTKVLTVTPLSTAFAAPPTSISLSPTTVAGGLPAGTLVGVLSAADTDTPEAHSFQFASGVGDSGNSYFTIDGERLFTAVVLDPTLAQTLSIRIQATDSTGNTVTSPLTVTVTGEGGNVDSDGDGVPDAIEALAHTNPNDPLDYLHITGSAVSAGGTGMALEWKSVTGLTYTVQISADPATGWTDIATVPSAGATTIYTALFPAAAEMKQRAFYRVVLKP